VKRLRALNVFWSTPDEGNEIVCISMLDMTGNKGRTMWRLNTGKLALAMLLVLGLCLAGNAQHTTLNSKGWAVISSPREASPGAPFEVQVDVKKLDGKTQLGLDLHWMHKDSSYGGFLAVGGRRDVEQTGPQTFRVTFNLQEGMAAVVPTVFLSPDGSWDRRTHDANGLAIIINATGAVAEKARPQNVTFKKSWINITPPNLTETYTEGDEFEIEVECFLDPSENWGSGTTLILNPLGPWIDNPDGKYTNRRFHVSYPGLSTREVKIPTGRSVQRFRFKVGKLYRHNSLLLVATFKDGDGKNWPWEVRESGPRLEEMHTLYELATGKVGGLFTYDEPVQLLLNFKDGVQKNVAKR
jgi:hypothetical protein